MNAKTEWPRILLLGTGDTITEELVEKRYRQLAQKNHPDMGGNTADMAEVNLAKQYALEWIERERNRIKVASIQPQYDVYARAIATSYQQQANHQSMWSNSMMGQAQGFGAFMQYDVMGNSAGAQSWQSENPYTNACKAAPEPTEPVKRKWWQFWNRAK